MWFIAFLQVFPYRRHAPQIRNDLFDILYDILHFLRCILRTDGQTERTVGHLMRQSQRQQHMTGIQRTGSAGRSGRSADTSGIQKQKQRLSLYALKAEIYRTRYPALAVAV